MSDDRHEKSTGEEAVDALKTLLARIGEIFGVFDLSFLVAGAVAMAALLFAGYLFDAAWFDAIKLSDWKAVYVAATILGCYVLGLVCFAAGRKLRPDQRFYLQLPQHLEDFGLTARYRDFLPGAVASSPPWWRRLARAFSKESAEERTAREQTEKASERCALLYTRLWAEVRQSKDLGSSFNLLTRYWVMAAMCDGLAAALLAWVVLWGFWMARLDTTPVRPPLAIMALLGVGFAGGTVLCFLEARRYTKYQMYEIVATLAYAHVPVDHP